jgi:hypothetical protein
MFGPLKKKMIKMQNLFFSKNEVELNAVFFYLDSVNSGLDSVHQSLAEERVHGAYDADEVVAELHERVCDHVHCGADTVHDNVYNVARSINNNIEGVLESLKSKLIL